MTQTLPFVPGTPERSRLTAAATALLETVPAGTEIVFGEFSPASATNQRAVAARVANLKARSGGRITGRTAIDHEANVVRAFLTRVPVESVVPTVITAPATQLDLVQTLQSVSETQLPTTTTETIEKLEEVVRRTRRRSRARKGRPAKSVEVALQQVLDARGKWVTVTNRSIHAGTVNDARRQYKSKQTQLLAAGRAGGLRVETKINRSEKTIWLTARLLES